MTPDNAIQMLEAGADLLQIYTGLIFQGPLFAGELNEALVQGVFRANSVTDEVAASP